MNARWMIGVLGVLLISSSAAKASVIWDTGDPLSNGYTVLNPALAGYTLDSPVQGVLTQSTTADNISRYKLTSGNATAELVNANGWYIETRINVASPTSAANGLYQVTLYASDGFGGFQLGLLPGSAAYYPNGATSLATYAAGYHTLKITRLPGNTSSFDVSVDGGAAITISDFVDATTQLQWGDGSGGGGPSVVGQAEWDYVAVNIPEPASLAIVGLAGGAMMVRRRR